MYFYMFDKYTCIVFYLYPDSNCETIPNPYHNGRETAITYHQRKRYDAAASMQEYEDKMYKYGVCKC